MLAILRGASPRLRASAFHSTVYASAGAAAYLSIWLAEHGLNPTEIGIVNAVPLILMLGLNLYIGRLADRAGDWRQALIVLSLLAGILPLALFFSSGFWMILIVWTLATLPGGSIPSITDAATLRFSQRTGIDFGSIRAWGTVGYTAFSALSGVAIGLWGTAAFVPLFVGLCLLRAILSFGLPRFKADIADMAPHAAAPEMPPPEVEPRIPDHRAARLRDVLKPWFILPIVAFSLINAAHAVLVAFTTITWTQQGIDQGMIGPLVAIAAAAEAVMMFVWGRIGGRFTARHLILASTLVSTFRWAVIVMMPPLWVLFLLQLLHAVTYGVGYFGTVRFIGNWTSESIAAEAQSLLFVVTQAATVVALLTFGSIVETAGIWSYLVCVGMSLVGAACVLISLHLKPSRQDPAVEAA